MLKQVRKKIASSISNSDEPEQFLWNKWLRAPITEYEIVTSPGVQIYDTENLNEWITQPSLQHETFDFTRVRVSKKIEKYFVPKSKTHKIFFGFGETVNQKVKISENNPLKFNVIAKLEQKDADTYMNLKKGDSNETSLKLNPQQKESVFKLKSSKAENVELPRNKPDAQKPKNLVDKNEISAPKLHSNEKENLVNLKTEIFNIELLKIDDLGKQGSGKEIKGSFTPIGEKTKISKIEVQSPDKLIKSADYTEKEKNKTIAFDKVESSPKIYKVKTSGIEKINAPVYYLKDIHPKEVNVINGNADISKYFEEEVKTEVIDPLKNISKDADTNLLASILQPSSGLKEADKEDILSRLLDFQKEGAEFLAGNQHCLIAEEMGTGKTLQAVTAVRLLFRQKSIKSAIVICPQFDAGSIDSTNRTGNPSGWAGHFLIHAPELQISIISGDETNEKVEKQSLAERWNCQASVFIVGYSSFIKSINYEIIDKERLKKFDCIIFDEAQNLTSKNITSYFSGLEDSSKPKFLFGLTSLPSGAIKSSIEPLFKTEKNKLEILQRKKSDAGKELPAIIKQEYWLDLDSNQKIEYANILSQGRDKLSQLVQAGNPFLIQSNVFTLIHQLKQACNFFSSSETSPKSELLLSQLEIISKTKKKAIIFSQYDRMGTQRLEQVLKKAGISSMVYQTSMPAREMDKIVRNFRTSKDTTALIFGLKAGNLNISLPDVHYIINYDNWWNPITLWQLEEKINCLEKDEPLNIYSYLNSDSVDLRISEMLLKKGLLEKNIIENLNPENIYEFFSSEDWLNVFQVPGSFEKETEERFSKALSKVAELTIDDFQNKLKLFFTRLGFKNLLLKISKNNQAVDISGTFLKNAKENRIEAKCIFSGDEPVKDFEEFLTHKADKLFVVSLKSLASKPQIKLPRNAAYINQGLFLNYLLHFKLI